MTQYAQIQDNRVISTGRKPTSIKLADGRWCSNPTDDILSDEGWQVVTATTPAPPEGQEVIGSAVQLVKGVATTVWEYADIMTPEPEVDRIAAIEDLLVEKGVVSRAEIDAKMETVPVINVRRIK